MSKWKICIDYIFHYPQDVSTTGEWSSMLADYIRKNDETMIKSSSALLQIYQQKMLAASSLEDMVGVLGNIIKIY
jgi:hypothetical protein